MAADIRSMFCDTWWYSRT